MTVVRHNPMMRHVYQPETSARSALSTRQFGAHECTTCRERKYKDGSSDSGVSFQTATKLNPSQASIAVSAHEQEHVTNERAKADERGQEVVSQHVTLHTDICPECGKPYISGGKTQTVTRPKPAKAEAGIGELIDIMV